MSKNYRITIEALTNQAKAKGEEKNVFECDAVVCAAISISDLSPFHKVLALNSIVMGARSDAARGLLSFLRTLPDEIKGALVHAIVAERLALERSVDASERGNSTAEGAAIGGLLNDLLERMMKTGRA